MAERRTDETVTGEVVDFVSKFRLEDAPSEAVTIAKRCMVDGVGVMLAGSATAAFDLLKDYSSPADGRRESTVFSRSPFATGAATAALLNGTSGHALDFDDTQLSTTPDRIFGLLTHPTVPPLVAALAVGERDHVSGARLLEAFLAGFEVECKIAEAIDSDHYKKGFHSSGTAGTFGAAIAVAKLLDLEPEALGHTLAIAASMASGIRVNFGSMTKPLHVGRAAQNGVIAAELARRGFTGGKSPLDPPWGYLSVFSHGRGFDADRIVGKLGKPHTIVSPGVSIKPYPCGVLGHPTMDAMRRLVKTHQVVPDDILKIRVRAGSNILNPLRYGCATNELEAKFSPAFMVSSIALRGKAGIHEFTDEFVRSEPVQKMMARVERVLDPDIEARGFEKIRSTVEVHLANGAVLVEAADEAYRGGPDKPFSTEDLHEKFLECASVVLSAAASLRGLELLESVEAVADVAQISKALAP